MDMTTREATVQASRQHTGIQVFEVEDGQSLKIETSPGGLDILNFAKPGDVDWPSVQVIVLINEVDK